uniref:Putative lim homeobox protein n=1 Tax=Schistosoma mansoni TaxID=6183 RepID=A0A3Q0KI86_SCHMA
MSTEYTVLDSSISSHPYSSNKQFVDDNQNNLMNNFISDIYSTSLFEQFPFSMKNFPSTGTSLPTNSPNLSSSLPLSSITVRKLSNMEIIQENDIHNINFQLYPNKYKLPLLSTHQLTDNHIHSISTIETNTPSTSTTTMDPLIKTQSNESNKSIIKRTKTYQKLIKDCTGCNQPIYEKIYLGLSDGQLWHMNCLNCNTCGKCLDKETSCFNRYGQIYCRKDYEQIFGSFKSRPVCTYCKQLISSNELIVRSINQLIFHSDCFCCNICHRIMKCGDRYELDNVSHQPICWEHYQQSHHHQLDSFLSCTDLCEGIKCLRESDHRDPGKLKELSGQIYSADGNTNLNFVHASDVLSIRDTDPDIEDLPTESSSRTDFLEHGNKLNLIDYGVNKQQPKSSVSSVIDKHKDEKYSRFNSYSIPLIGKDSSAIELLPNCLSHKPIHYLPPLSHHLLQDNSSYSPCNLFNQPLRKLESDSSSERLSSLHETSCSSCPLSSSSHSPSVLPLCTSLKSISSYPSSACCSIPFTSACTPTFSNISAPLLSLPPHNPSSLSSSSPPSSGTRFMHKHLDVSPLNYSSLLSNNNPSTLVDFIDTKNPSELNKSIDSNVLIQHVQQQKRNRKRRSGIHQVFENDCFNSGTNFYLGITTRQKRMRTSFKHHQLRTMKAYFNINHNPDVKDLKVLTEKTGLSKRVLQVWFQNARAKYRRNLVRQENTSTSVNNHINNSLTSGLITSSNCGSSEMIGNSISECDSQSSQINPDDFTISQTTPSSTSPQKNDLIQDDDDDDDNVDDDDEERVNDMNDIDNELEHNQIMGVLNKNDCQTNQNIQAKQCENSNLIDFEDNLNCSHYHDHHLTNELHKLTSHSEHEQQMQQPSINLTSCITSINSFTLNSAYNTDNMLISQNNNNNNNDSNSNNSKNNNYNLLHTNKIYLENEHQLTTNMINYTDKLNNLVLSNKCHPVNCFTLTRIH